jgi:large subunit ribosomal protein L28
MARRCELSGKGVATGNNVSHANNKTRRRFLPNLNKTGILSDSLKQSVSFRVATSTLRTIDHVGGLDAYLLKTPDAKLSPRARQVKKLVQKKQATA